MKFLREDFIGYRNCKPSTRAILGLFVSNPGFRAVTLFRFQQFFHGRGLVRIALWVSSLNQIITGAEFCVGCQIGRNLQVRHPAGIVIGGNVTIGNNFIVQQGVTIGEKYSNAKSHSGSPTLGNFVTVGANSVLAGPITVGDRVTIGALTLVIDSFPIPGVVIGIPGHYSSKSH